MPAEKLTKSKIDRFTYSGGADVRWDTLVTGLGLRIYPSGRKSFMLSYRNAHGEKQRMTLGRFGSELTLDQARALAKDHLSAVRHGRDPLKEKQEAAQGETIQDLITAYIERHAKPRKRSWKEDERRLNYHIPNSWRQKKAKAITRDLVADLHGRIGRDAPYEANRLLALLSKMFELAKVWGHREETSPNPAQGIEKFPETKRKRWVKPEEVPALIAAIDQEANIYVRAAIFLYLLTGLRKTELLQAKRSDIDFNRAELRLPYTKAGEEQVAPLNAAAMAIIQATPVVHDNPYLLPGRRHGQHLVNITKPWIRIRRQAGIEDVRLHDLRRTVGSWLSQSQVEINTVKAALRHADLSTTLTYARLGADPAREAMEAHGRKVMEIAGRPKLVEADNE